MSASYPVKIASKPAPAFPLAAVSVALATRDRPQALARCLDALLAGRRLPAEIIVIDQSRADASQRVVERFRETPTRLCYVGHAGQGLGAAQNIAIARAAQPVVAVTDDDCVPAPDWVERIERALAAGPGLAGLAGRVLPLAAEGKDLYPVASRTSVTRMEFNGLAPPWQVGSGNNFAVRRAWLTHVGGTDERLGPGSPGQGGVDMDLFYRLLRAGARIRYEPGLRVYHEQADRAGRLARRFPYGYGMGACCSLWLRQRDLYALPVLAHWLWMRFQRLLNGLRRGDRLLMQEEALVLAGTVGGLAYGLRVPHRQPGLKEFA